MDTGVLGGSGASEALSVVESAPDMETAVTQIRDLLGVDHLVYHSSKYGTSPSVDPYIRLTYPAAWIKRYLQMGYVHIDPVLREGFLRTLPFAWSELKIETQEEGAMLMDALSHGVGPQGFSIPVRSKRGHRGLFSISSSVPLEDWEQFCKGSVIELVEIANGLHQRMIREEFGEGLLFLSEREIQCLYWTAQGKDAADIAGILSISHHTARDYLKSARHKLECVTSAQAVSKAVKLGILIL